MIFKCTKCGGTLEKPRTVQTKRATCQKCQRKAQRDRDQRYRLSKTKAV